MLGDELKRRWLGENTSRQSLRGLAVHEHRQVLEAAIEQADGATIGREVENLYRSLTADDVTAGGRAQAESKLDGIGVDVDTIRQDFGSHQAVHSYLTKVRGLEPPERDRSSSESVEDRLNTVQRLRNRLVAATEHSLESLRDAGHLSLGSFDVTVNFAVCCNVCRTSYDSVELLRHRGCECSDESS